MDFKVSKSGKYVISSGKHKLTLSLLGNCIYNISIDGDGVITEVTESQTETLFSVTPVNEAIPSSFSNITQYEHGTYYRDGRYMVIRYNGGGLPTSSDCYPRGFMYDHKAEGVFMDGDGCYTIRVPVKGWSSSLTDSTK
jgi:hypothetical protein